MRNTGKSVEARPGEAGGQEVDRHAQSSGGMAAVTSFMALAAGVAAQTWRAAAATAAATGSSPVSSSASLQASSSSSAANASSKDAATCGDMLGPYLAMGFQSGGLTVWRLGWPSSPSSAAGGGASSSSSSSQPVATEVVCETSLTLDTNHMRLLRIMQLLPHDAKENDVELAFVDARRVKTLRFYRTSNSSSSTTTTRPELAADDMLHFAFPIQSLVCQAESALAAVVFENHSAQLFDRHTRTLLASIPATATASAGSTVALPLAVSLRWYAHGAYHGLPASASSSSSDASSSALPQQQQGGGGQQLASLTLHMLAQAKSLIKPIQHDAVLVKDYRKRDELVVRLALPVEGVGHLQFDASGSLLVSCSEDGQSLLVFSLPGGYVQHRLERGYSPGTILRVQFSPSREHLAATTARGTTHIFSLPPPAQEQQLVHQVAPPAVHATSRIRTADVVLAPVLHVGFSQSSRRSTTPTRRQRVYVLSGHTLCEHDAQSAGLVRSWDLARETGETALAVAVTAIEAVASTTTSSTPPVLRAKAKTGQFDAQPFVPCELPVWRASSAFALMQTSETFALHSFTSQPHDKTLVRTASPLAPTTPASAAAAAAGNDQDDELANFSVLY